MAHVVAALALLVTLCAARGAAAQERLPGVWGGESFPTLRCGIAQIPGDRAGLPPISGQDSSLLDVQSPPPALARPQLQSGPDGKHADDDRVAGGDVIALSAPAGTCCVDEREAARAITPCESAHMSVGARTAHPARGPPAGAAGAVPLTPIS